MKQKKGIGSEIMSAAIMCVMFLAMLVLVVFAAKAYRSSVSIQAANNDTRAVLSYVVTAVKAGKTDHIQLEEIDGVNTLVIIDDQSGLAQHIYYKDGKLLENYGAVGYAFKEDSETVIAQTGRFEMSMLNDNLLQIVTDAGNSYVNLGG